MKIEIIKGMVKEDIYGSYEDCSPGTYIGHNKIDMIFREYIGKVVKITIEPIEDIQEPL